jgi:hypothetical protein
MFFLIAYDRRTQSLTLPLETFKNGEASAARRRRLDVQLSLPQEEGRYEVVLLEGNSLEDIHETHARYFATNEAELIEQARGDARAGEQRARERRDDGRAPTSTANKPQD